MATSFSYAKTQKNECKIWAGLSVPAAGEYLTLDANGDPDATENPNRILLGLTESGAITRINMETEDEFFDEFDTPLGQSVTQRAMNMSASLSEIFNIDTLELITKGIGTKFTDSGVEGVTIGSGTLGYTSIAAISPRRNDETKFVVSHIYNASAKVAAEIAFSRQTRSSIPVEFIGTPIPSRAAADQIGAFWFQT